jgi:LacI family transcriptional regulator
MTSAKTPPSTSVREVARRAGVSVGTVSNVLNRPDMVAQATLARVRQAIDELGFVRNESARQLRAGHSRTIGLIVLDITNPFFTDMARGVEDAASAAGLSVILCNSDDDPDKEARYMELLVEQRVQGVLVVPSGDEAQLAGLAARRDIPVVLVDHHLPRPDGCSVSVDDVAGGALAVRHLLELGHRRIAYVGGGGSAQVEDRRRGARQAAHQWGADHASVASLEVASLNVAGGREAAHQLAAFPDGDRPTAAFCANDLLALGLVQEWTSGGRAVPGDLSVVGYDDIEFAGSAGIPLTSVRQPRHELGQVAAAMVLEEGADPAHVHRQVVFEPELVVRASTGPRPSGTA